MKFRIDFTKQGSEAVVDKLCEYIESWEYRKNLQQSRIGENLDKETNPECSEINKEHIQDFSNSDMDDNVLHSLDVEIKKISMPKREISDYDISENEADTSMEETCEEDAISDNTGININKNDEEDIILDEDSNTISDIESQNDSLESDIEDNLKKFSDINESEEQEENNESELESNLQNEENQQDIENNNESDAEVSITQIEQQVTKSPRRPQNLNKMPENKKKKSKKINDTDNVQPTEKENDDANDEDVFKARTNTKKRKKAKLTGGKIALRICGSVGTFLLAIVFLVVIADLMILYGPSKAARDRFVLTVTETSAAGFLATWFMNDETVNSIIEESGIQGSDGSTDTTLIEFPDTKPGDESGETSVDLDSVELIDIEGKTYRGKLLIVQNPKRVYLGTPEAYGQDKEGIETINMVKITNALYGVNGGGFYDTGKGNGGIPTGRENSSGIVISKGKLMWGSLNREYEIIGINKQGVLVLGNMTAQEALDQGIVEALNFGPFLVMNAEACEVGGLTEAGLNPRTAIGQRKDGAMLILTIDGRQPSSMGASYEDLIEVMMNYGAVNAANLDGGSSTYMVQNSETENNPQIITQCASLYGPRKMATSVLVSRVDQINEQYE